MPPPADQVHSMWIKRLDALAEQANADYEYATTKAPADDVIGSCLAAIASQLAYGNAIQAANYYIANKLWTMPGEDA